MPVPLDAPVEPPDVVDDPPVVPVEPPEVVDDPPAVPDEPPDVVDDPPAVPVEPPDVVDDPPAVPDEPVDVVVDPPALPVPPDAPPDPAAGVAGVAAAGGAGWSFVGTVFETLAPISSPKPTELEVFFTAVIFTLPPALTEVTPLEARLVPCRLVTPPEDNARLPPLVTLAAVPMSLVLFE